MPSKPTIPGSAYVREDYITSHIDAWLARLFDPDNIDQIIAARSPPLDDAPLPPRAETRQTIAELGQELDRHRLALEAGTYPALIANWTVETQAARAAASRLTSRAGQRWPAWTAVTRPGGAG